MRKGKYRRHMEMAHMLTEDAQDSIVFGGRVSVQADQEYPSTPRHLLERTQSIVKATRWRFGNPQN